MRSADSFSLVLRDVDVAGSRVDVGIVGDRVAAVAPRLDPSGVREVDGGGAALLPGLHDHHLHLLAMAAALDSVDCTGASGPEDLAARIRAAPVRDGWVRAVGYHESIAGPLDRRRLDAIRSDQPLRVQHRSGALWMLNSAALARVDHVLDDTADVERDPDSLPNGRLWRYDTRLAAAVPSRPLSLAAVAEALARFGVTGVTDATPNLAEDSVALLDRARTAGELPQRVILLGAPDDAALPRGFQVGPWKLHLRDHDLPSVDDLTTTIGAAHERGRAVAVHCVTAEALVVTLAALRAAGPRAGDRIEHASVVPPALVADLVASGVAVVTQPSFVRRRGVDYLRDVPAAEQPWLYPWASLAAAGIRVAPSSDAPHGSASPWEAIATASERSAADGRRVAAHEAVDRRTALEGYLSPGSAPGGPARCVRPGADADLVLLRGSLDAALAAAPANPVRLTVIEGRVVHDDALNRTPPGLH